VSQELSQEAKEAIGRIEKLFRLAARNPNQHEAQQATSKAYAIMAAFNLDMAAVEENSGDAAKRADEKLKGGHYQFQRDLWERVADLHFCLYFTITAVERKPKYVPRDLKRPEAGFKRIFTEKRFKQHRLVGRLVNVKLATVTAQYLEETVERLTAERLGETLAGVEKLGRSQLYGKWAMDFRSGIIEAIGEKITARQKELKDEERRKAQEAEAKARENGFADTSLKTAVTLASFQRSEKEANLDFLHGEGWCAKQAAQEAADRAAWAKARAEDDAWWAEYQANNPEEYQRLVKEEEQRQRRNARRRANYIPSYRESGSSSAKKVDWGARRAGYEVGQHVSIDRQAAGTKIAGRLK
jgi:hypothetical protein